MESAVIIALAALFLSSVALTFAVLLALRVNRMEWEVEQFKTEVQTGVSPFPIPFEPSEDPEQALRKYTERRA